MRAARVASPRGALRVFVWKARVRAAFVRFGMLKRIIVAVALATWLLTPASRQVLAADAGHAPAEQHEPGAAHQGGGATAHEGGDHAKPPLLPDPMARETQLHALWVVIIFVVLLAVLYPTAWKQVLAGLKKREERIRKDIADAEAARARAEATLREYQAQLAAAENKVREMIGGAVAQGEKMAADIRAKAQKEAEETKGRATREIEAAGKQAVAEIYEKAAEISTAVAEKILRRNINAEDQRDLVRRSLEELQSVK